MINLSSERSFRFPKKHVPPHKRLLFRSALFLLIALVPLKSYSQGMQVIGLWFKGCEGARFDDYGNLYSDWQWQNINGTVYVNPVLHVAGSYSRVDVKVWVTGAPTPPWYVEVKGNHPLRPYHNWFSITSGGNYANFPMSNNAYPFPSYVGFSSAYTIVWQWRLCDQYLEPIGPWNDMGTTTVPVYLCLQAPVGVKLYHSVIHHACATAGARTRDEAVAKSWSRFTGRTVETWDGRDLHYYEPGIAWAGDRFSLAALLADANGQCTSWAEFLSAVCRVNGASTTLTLAYPIPFPEFFVKDWTLDGTAPYTVSFPRYGSSSFTMFDNPGGNDYGELISLSTLGGQYSNPPAEKVFVAHQIVKYMTEVTQVKTAYDPSYGMTYTSVANFDSSAVYGYAPVPHLVNNLMQTDVQLNNPGVVEVRFDPPF